MKIKFTTLLISLFLISWNNSVKAQWNCIKHTSDYSITCFAQKDTNIFAGTIRNGILISNNNGTSWKAIDKGLPKDNCRSIYALIIDQKNILAGGSHGIFISKDNGLNWKESDSGIDFEYSIVQSFIKKDSTIFACAFVGGGIYSTTNNGKKWIACNNGFTDNHTTSLATYEKYIFAGSNKSGVYMSDDDGKSWKAVNNGLPSVKSIKSLAVSGTTIFAGTDGGGVSVFANAPEGNGVYISTDNGSSWNPSNKGNENKTIQALEAFGTNIFAIISGELFVSKDNGKNWINISTDLPEEIGIGTVIVVDSTIYIGTNAGIWTNNTFIKNK